MLATDFETYGIKHFTRQEVQGTGADLRDVNVEVIIGVDMFRECLGIPVLLLPYGLTTGEHSSIYHKNGNAVDVCFWDAEQPPTEQDILCAGLSAGFHGIGIYFNDFAFSVHLDRRRVFEFWAGRKKHGEQEWRYYTLLKEVRKL